MKSVVARIELHKNKGEKKIPSEAYTELHELMAGILFYRHIHTMDNGELLATPPAEYICPVTEFEQARKQVLDTLSILTRRYSILFIDADRIIPFNLETRV